MSDESQDVLCSVCGKKIDPQDAEKKWRKCEWCKKPTCFDCSRYLGVSTPGLYQNHLRVVRLCKKCYPEKGMTRE